MLWTGGANTITLVMVVIVATYCGDTVGLSYCWTGVANTITLVMFVIVATYCGDTVGLSYCWTGGANRITLVIVYTYCVDTVGLSLFGKDEKLPHVASLTLHMHKQIFHLHCD